MNNWTTSGKSSGPTTDTAKETAQHTASIQSHWELRWRLACSGMKQLLHVLHSHFATFLWCQLPEPRTYTCQKKQLLIRTEHPVAMPRTPPSGFDNEINRAPINAVAICRGMECRDRPTTCGDVHTCNPPREAPRGALLNSSWTSTDPPRVACRARIR